MFPYYGLFKYFLQQSATVEVNFAHRDDKREGQICGLAADTLLFGCRPLSSILIYRDRDTAMVPL